MVSWKRQHRFAEHSIQAALTGLKEAPEGASPAQSRKHRILCVDDEIEGTRIRGEILVEEGYSVVLYHSPLAALRAHLLLFDLAIVDFRMPELNGRELLLRMRALGARFPVVLLTGAVDTRGTRRRRCLPKPAVLGSPRILARFRSGGPAMGGRNVALTLHIGSRTCTRSCLQTLAFCKTQVQFGHEDHDPSWLDYDDAGGSYVAAGISPHLCGVRFVTGGLSSRPSRKEKATQRPSNAELKPV